MSRNFELLRKSQGEPVEIITRPAIAAPQRIVTRPVSSPATQRGADWLVALNQLRKHWKLAAAFAGVVMLTVTIATLIAKPVYEPSARLEIDPPGSQMFSPDRGSSSIAEYVETQAQNLQTDALAVMVIRSLRLDKNPDFVKKATEDVPASVGDGTAPQLTPGENTALNVFRGRLKVQRDPTSRLITVSFASHDPVTAATVTNTLINTYIQTTYEMRKAAIAQSTEWLSKQLDDIKQKMQDSNRALADFQNATGIIDIDNNKSTFADKMTDLNKQKTQAAVDRIQLESYLSKIRSGNADSLPQIRANAVVQALTQKLAEAKAELAQTTIIYGVNHPNVKKLQNQADELDRQIKSQRQAIIDELRTSYSAAVSREQMMAGEIKGTSTEMTQLAQYNTLKRDAEANTQLYNNLYAKVKETAIAAASPFSDIRVVDAARVLSSPTRPNRLLNLIAGFLFAVIGGILCAFVRDRFDTRIRTVEEVRESLGLANVSVLPMIVQSETGWRARLLPGSRGVGPEQPFMLRSPISAEGDALRGLETSILLSQQGRPQVILITSSFPGEGKTTVAANLAVALAQHGPTCLVDADMRRPRIAGMFRVDPTGGLTSALAASTAAPFLKQVEEVPNLAILPAGTLDHSPVTLINSDGMREIIEELRKGFEFVVIDSPPVLPFADARALATQADGIVYVGRSGVTTREAMARSMELLQSVKSAPVLEVVLNAAHPASAGGYGYRYNYQYRS